MAWTWRVTWPQFVPRRIHDGRSEDGFVGPGFPSGIVCRWRDGCDGGARSEPPGEQFPARRIGIWRARRTGHDRGLAGRETKRRGAPRQPGPAARKFFSCQKGSAEGGGEIIAGLRNIDEDSRRDVARGWDSA